MTATLKQSVSNLHGSLKTLRKRYHQLLAKKHSSCSSLDLRLKGVHLVKTCRLAQKHVLAGVSALCVPDVIKICADAFDIDIMHIPSVCSIGRFVLEGGIGAEIQISNTLAQAQGVLFILFIFEMYCQSCIYNIPIRCNT
jgi:hypothetical protein